MVLFPSILINGHKSTCVQHAYRLLSFYFSKTVTGLHAYSLSFYFNKTATGLHAGSPLSFYFNKTVTGLHAYSLSFYFNKTVTGLHAGSLLSFYFNKTVSLQAYNMRTVFFPSILIKRPQVYMRTVFFPSILIKLFFLVSSVLFVSLFLYIIVYQWRRRGLNQVRADWWRVS